MKPYRLSRRAKADLDDIWSYSKHRWGSWRAADYLREIQAVIEMIAERPDLGWPDDSLRPGYRRRTAGSHVIFYRIGVGVEIVRVLHQSMNARAHLG
ncbi:MULTISPECIES: type II toxin-antitoxin system RelE/ParE family toxin [Caulobacter]|jgi:toxin ParE1/3/4|uniref:Toxin n=1 Tax=Caulobacter vibrioides OR37 TaxID=1292034 RepID=R0EGF7_CAUVI|nr:MULTISPECIES: type II toxin-antitoxin system RelE/ParE family toxin [Caulobacter]ENZ81114.1 plasmid stabilization system protein [Caulobacter vibrioides OR37]MBQ1559925.1 type II toxin-antitoxin system RelE/ParE family toxin [Caulobacter sp.]